MCQHFPHLARRDSSPKTHGPVDRGSAQIGQPPTRVPSLTSEVVGTAAGRKPRAIIQTASTISCTAVGMNAIERKDPAGHASHPRRLRHGAGDRDAALRLAGWPSSRGQSCSAATGSIAHRRSQTDSVRVREDHHGSIGDRDGRRRRDWCPETATGTKCGLAPVRSASWAATSRVPSVRWTRAGRMQSATNATERVEGSQTRRPGPVYLFAFARRTTKCGRRWLTGPSRNRPSRDRDSVTYARGAVKDSRVVWRFRSPTS